MKRQVVAFRAFLVLLGACILVTSGLWFHEEYEASLLDESAKEDDLEFRGHQHNCEKAISDGATGSLSCEAAERHHESRDRKNIDAIYRRADAHNYLLTLIFLPLALALCFYAGRWILTGRLRPFWLLHDD
jgi:hypothetical protein